MVAFQKFNQFIEDVSHQVHDFKTGTSHVLKIMLTNTAPVAGNAIRSDITELTTGGGYTSGGISVGTITGAQTSGTMKVVGGTDPVWTGSGGGFGPFRYAVLYNDTPTSPVDPLIGFWDYGSSITVLASETFTADTDQTNGLFQLA